MPEAENCIEIKLRHLQTKLLRFERVTVKYSHSNSERLDCFIGSDYRRRLTISAQLKSA